jgi:transposase
VHKEIEVELIYQRCCGIDIPKKTLVACLMTPGPAGERHTEIRTLGTVTAALLNLHAWLPAAGCSHVALESTGVYWKPAYNLREEDFEGLIVNAQHLKAVPGRKTDVRDAEWIADLLPQGLLRASYIPPAAQREVRELTRYRTSLVQERARAVNRLQKTWEDTTRKLGDVATDFMGKSARAMGEALLAGQTDPAKLADLAPGRLKAKRVPLEQALVGVLKPHHRFLLTEHLSLIDTLDEALTRASQQIVQRLDPPPDPTKADAQQGAADHQSGADLETCHQTGQDQEQDPTALSWGHAIVLLCSMPGISQRAAEGILAEIGSDMSRFPPPGHRACWAGMCPGNRESAGKRLSGRTTKGSPWLRQLLVAAAHAAAPTKQTYLSAQYHRLAGRRGKQKALMAVGHSILVIIDHLVDQRVSYKELGGNFCDARDRKATEKRLVRR